MKNQTQSPIHNQIFPKQSKQNIKQFIPFINQRYLGKLICNTSCTPIPSHNINFKTLQSTNNNIKQQNINQLYQKLTQSNHKQPINPINDLVSFKKGWTITDQNNKKRKVIKSKSSSIIRDCSCFYNQQKDHQFKILPFKFDVNNQQLLKKIGIQKPIHNIVNPQIQEILKHYVEIYQLNEKIKKSELTKKQKF